MAPKTDLKNLPEKERKQIIVLGVLLAAIVLAGGFYLFSGSADGEEADGERPLKPKEKLELLETRIEQAERLIKRGAEIQANLDEALARQKAYVRNIPPVDNRFTWVTERVYACARQAGIEIELVDQLAEATGAEGGRIKPYAVRIQAHGGFDALRGFLRRMETENPLLRLVQLQVTGGTEPERHRLILDVDWPLLVEPPPSAPAGAEKVEAT
jgi:hypothetical protein